MTIEQQILAKLEPHSKRIQDGSGNDFDYLPAVLLQLMEEQKRQARLLDSLKSTVDTVGVHNKAQMTAFESAAQRKLEQLETEVKHTQTQLQNSQSSINEQIAVFASAHAVQARQTNEGLSATGLQIKSLASDTQQSQVKFTRILIAGLVASTVMIGLAIAILQRH